MTDGVERQSARPPAHDNEVGEILARARAALGLTVEDCAQQIKFSAKKLDALEQGRYDLLPGGTFARGMLRAYARLLNLDADSLVPRIAHQIQVPDTTDVAVSLRRPIPFVQAGKRGNLVYAGLSIAALAVVAWVGYEWLHERDGAARLTFIPAAQAPAAHPRPAVVATVNPVIAPIRQDKVEERKGVLPPAAAAAEDAKAPAGTGTAPAETDKLPAERQGPPAAGLRRIVMSFEREAWVEVRGGDGRKLLAQVNRAGSERVIDGEPPFSLIVGNARHVRVIYDEQPVDLGPHTKVEVARLTLQ